MTKRQLKKLRADCEAWMAKYKARGGKVTTYFCGHCQKPQETPRPKRADVGSKGYWDSAKSCANCGEMSFVKVFPNGKTEARILDGGKFKLVTVNVKDLLVSGGDER